jgi:hypothetical protein
MSNTLPTVRCPLCGAPLRFSLANSRKARTPKVFVMLVCPEDARHLRGFISDQAYVRRVVAHLDDATGTGTQGGSAVPVVSDVFGTTQTGGVA